MANSGCGVCMPKFIGNTQKMTEDWETIMVFIGDKVKEQFDCIIDKPEDRTDLASFDFTIFHNKWGNSKCGGNWKPADKYTLPPTTAPTLKPTPAPVVTSKPTPAPVPVTLMPTPAPVSAVTSKPTPAPVSAVTSMPTPAPVDVTTPAPTPKP